MLHVLVSYEILKAISIHIQKGNSSYCSLSLLQLVTPDSCKSSISIHFYSCLHQISKLPMALRGSQLPQQTPIFFTILFLSVGSTKWLDLMQHQVQFMSSVVNSVLQINNLFPWKFFISHLVPVVINLSINSLILKLPQNIQSSLLNSFLMIWNHSY